MGNLVSFLYLLVFLASGVFIANAALSFERPRIRLWLGGVIGLAMLLWLPALFAFLTGFTELAQLLALLTAAAIGAVCLIVHGVRDLFRVPRREALPLLALVPLLATALVLLSSHTIVEKNGALYVGQSTYGDLAMHLGFITSIGEQATFPPMYSICPDTVVGYPFLSDSISSTFYVLGASLRFATILPAAYAMALVFLGVYLFLEGWLKKQKTAVLAAWLFFLGGGFGFAYFFDLAKLEPGKLTQMLSAFYETPTNSLDVGLRWVNPIADMLIPQRATLFGWALLFPCLYLLYRAAFERKTELFLPLALLAGCLPLVHTHSFFALGVISFVYLFRAFLKKQNDAQLWGFLKYGLIAVLLASPQLFGFTFRQSQGFLKLHWNWANTADSFLWFYIKNWGLLFLLLPAAFFSVKRETRGVMAGPLFLWLLAETVQFQPNTYDNNKLLFVLFAFLCGLIADYLVRAAESLGRAEGRRKIGTACLSAVVCTALFLSGIMTLVREAVSSYELIGKSECALADYVRANAAPDATFLTHNNHNNAVAALTGRNIVCGSPSYLFFHGIDYYAREDALRLLYEEPELYFASLSKRYAADYVVISSAERMNYAVDTSWFDAHLTRWYSADGIVVYQVS